MSTNNKDTEKTEKVKIENLKLNKETVKDLGEAEAEKVKGGAKPVGGGAPQSACARGCLSWSHNYCPEE